jgi:hypothetical protein
VQWLPGESWPGGKQADARLDRPVTLWVTGAPLRDVFAQLEAQTGVHFGFDPPGDDNARLCVNVYLNPTMPPSLREVMAQFSWVMDCGFAVTGEGEARQYLLLSAGPPGDLGELWWEQEVERRRRDQEASERQERELRQAAVPRLLELRAALGLPREEAIRRYRGSDDALLLVLLQPWMRSRAEIVTAFSEEQIGEFAEGGALEFNAPSWTPEQRALAEACSGLPSVEQDQYGKPWVTGARIDVMPWDGGGISMSWSTEANWDPEVGAPSAGSPVPLLPFTGRVRFWEDTLTLRRLLGEPVTPEIEQAVQQEWAARQQEEQGANEQRDRAALLAAVAGDVSPATRERLAKLSVPLSLKEPHSLWEVQQAVASASGMNVVSDHFWQPVRPTDERAGFLFPKGLPQANALLLLALVCSPCDEEDSGSDWGDAGAFLRFRSRDRAAWRAALLPQKLLDAIDAELAPRIPPAKESPQTIHITVETRPYQALIIGLSQRQLDSGGLIADGHPAGDPLRAARDAVLAGLARSQRDLAFLAGFSEAQWAKLQTKGLEAAGDLSLDQLEYLRNRLVEGAGNLREITLRLDPMPGYQEGEPMRRVLQSAAALEVRQHLFNLRLFRGDRPISDGAVVRSVEITLHLPAAKPEAPGGG